MAESALPKLIWHSNAPFASTGYAQQTALFLPRLKDRYDLVCSAFWGVEGGIIPWNGIPVCPGIGGTYGNDTIHDHANVHFAGDLRNGLVFTLMDVWVLEPAVWRQLNTACWVPVDHEPAPPPIVEFFANSGSVPIAMSRFGERMLEELDPLYCPHAIDTTVYRPFDTVEAREATKMPQDAFIVGMVAANKGNPSRKCFAEAFRAFKVLHDRHPEARLYLHTEATGKFDGVNLPVLMDAVGLDKDVVFFCDQYRAIHYPFKADTMAHIFSSLDVLLMPSAGEGFGVPAIEAQACGVPVIASDFSAQPELVGAGWLVSGRTHYTPLKAFQFRPDIEDIVEALEGAYREARSPVMAEKARGFAVGYDVETVLYEHMLPALEQAAERFEERTPRVLKAAA